MIIVSDTSPVSNLILIQRLDILQKLFSEIIVPPAVDEEIHALKQFDVDLSEYENAQWIKISQPMNLQKVQTLQIKLDAGEAQAIVLALETNCDLLLMDERIGTNVARAAGLQTVGLVGVLIKAKQENLIPKVSEVLHDLKTLAGFWLGDKLENKILKELGEVQ
jgi:predicted nucleic acid-binding protein